MTAVQNGSENVVALLLALGAKTELVTKDTGLRAIDLAQQLKLLQLIILLSVSSGEYMLCSAIMWYSFIDSSIIYFDPFKNVG